MPTPTNLERPVTLSAACVRAVLSGRKTSLRHPVPAPSPNCPLGGPGSVLWVREPWAWSRAPGSSAVLFEATDSAPFGSMLWQPAATMRPEHSRLQLLVRSARVERLRDIPAEELTAEGALWREQFEAVSDRAGFAVWWDSLHPEPGMRWVDNPWVWALSFEPIRPHAPSVLMPVTA